MKQGEIIKFKNHCDLKQDKMFSCKCFCNLTTTIFNFALIFNSCKQLLKLLHADGFKFVIPQSVIDVTIKII